MRQALEELADDVVFIGGAAVSLYADKPSEEVRPTDDVDILIELLKYDNYADLEVKLREKGFVNDMESGVICRYKINGIIVDIMPTRKGILGFANQWYEEGYATSVAYNINKADSIRIFQSPWFIASKLEAFNDRGEADGRFSSDFEDIIFVLNNRTTVWKELHEVKGPVAGFLKEQFLILVNNPFIDEWISGNLEHSEQGRVRTILGEMQRFVEM